MIYIECPTEYTPDATPLPSVFLAGGISDCDEWQTRMVELLAPLDLVVINPRRKNFPIDDPAAAEGQIRWEFRHLRRATARLFWFPGATLCPITLYELGTWSAGNAPLFVGVDPAYARRRDVDFQTKLIRPDVRVVYSLQELARQVEQFVIARLGLPAPSAASEGPSVSHTPSPPPSPGGRGRDGAGSSTGVELPRPILPLPPGEGRGEDVCESAQPSLRTASSTLEVTP